jgi:hypothetical protein
VKKRIINLWPGGTAKALTLSYDDGVGQDKRLVEIFNKYKLRATFNLNSGIQDESNQWVKHNIVINRINVREIKELYKGHEVAIHSLNHPHLENLSRELVEKEIFEDRKNLEKIFGYMVRGMAYPYGTYNKIVLDVLKSCGIEYSRTVEEHEKFSLPENYLEWGPTCHHTNSKLMELTKDFINNQAESQSLFYVWGHSYEFDVDDNWRLIEEFAQVISNRVDIWYATNIEIVDYLNALKSLKYSVDYSMVYNPSVFSVWINVDGKNIIIKSCDTVVLY